MDTNTQIDTLISDPLQERAIEVCCGTEARVAAVTGQAGTGKTTILKKVFRRFQEAGYNVALAAPTGKAAKRIAEATGLPAVTLHRLLEFTHPGDPDEKTGKPIGVSVPRRNKQNRLECNVVLVDEYSMVHSQLNRDLLDALPAGGLLRCFGDINQLPPIEEDKSLAPDHSPFKELMKLFPQAVVELKHIYRQGEGSGIVQNGHKILNGFCPTTTEDFVMRIGVDPVRTILDLVANSGVDFTALDNQIITTMNKSWIGQVALNRKIQELIRKDEMFNAHVMPRSKWDKNDLMLLAKDKVIWKKNDYELNVFNGETGIIQEITDDTVIVDFGDRVVGVPPWIQYTAADGSTKGYDPRVNIYLAYALTTHSCQGSEYQHIVYVMDRATNAMHCRPNFYTAITRARKKAWLISDQRSLQQAVTTKFTRF